ncbi:hypothetical protein D3C72_1837030 [compost metagenome]
MIPTADNTTSASITSIPFADLIFTLLKLPEVSTDCTSDEVKILIPCFFKLFSNCFDISSSSTGTILSMNSTTVTFVPIAL